MNNKTPCMTTLHLKGPAALLMIAGLLALAAPLAPAAGNDEVTMQVIDSEDFAEDTIVSEIKLPEKAAIRAQERSAFGLETANKAREQAKKNFGQERAAAARERGRQNRPDNPNRPENPGNPNRPENPGNPNRPENPGNPNRPENPGNPNNP